MQQSLVVGVEQSSVHVYRNTAAPVAGIQHVMRRGWLPRGGDGYRTGSAALRSGLHVPHARHGDVDVMHLWNAVSLGRSPWGVTLESTLPRGPLPGTVRDRLQRRLTSPDCRFVVGFSRHALERFHRTLPPAVRDVVRPKSAAVHPYQAVRADAQVRRPPAADEPLRLLLVGRAFLRKGGEAVLRTVELVGDELDLELTVVSAAHSTDYATRAVPTSHLADLRRRLATHPRVHWLLSIPNDEVYELASRCHIGLLPTVADTFGYSALEFMSCGTPVIATDVESMPEVVDEGCGWTMPVPHGSDGRWTGLEPAQRATPDAYLREVDHLVAALTAVLREVRRDPMSVSRRSAGALERVETRFGSQRAEAMAAVYANSCADLLR